MFCCFFKDFLKQIDKKLFNMYIFKKLNYISILGFWNCCIKVFDIDRYIFICVMLVVIVVV